jgi:hypothetical protein
MLLDDEHVGEKREDDVVGHDAREPDLLSAAIEPEHERARDRLFDACARAAFLPSRSTRETRG